MGVPASLQMLIEEGMELGGLTPFSEKKKLRLVIGGQCGRLSREDTESSQLFRAKLLREGAVLL